MPTIPNGRRGRSAAALALAAIALATVTGAARADYGPGAEAASANGTLLGDGDSTAPGISGDGRYVVFATKASAILGSPLDEDEVYTDGIVRRDMTTGAVALVAPPKRVLRATRATVVSPGATGAASISGNGRYVLFETALPLVPGDLNADTDVYVRDMTRPETDASAYELVSALDGSDSAPGYLDDDASNPARGATAGRPGFALSDDGRTAVFTTGVRSDLPAGAATAPRGQVFVRELDASRTLLVTRDRSDPSPNGTPVEQTIALPAPLLSGNGRDVVWIDTNPVRQTPTLPGEPAVAALLWRDITAGPSAPTRRVAGTIDPDDPGCAAGSAFPSGGETDTNPCFGPFAASEAIEAGALLVSQLSISDDGTRVLFLSAAHQRPYDPTIAGNIAYLADMTPGLPRKRAVRRVLRALGDSTALLGDVLLSGSGTRLAFTSNAIAFEGPRSVGALPSGDPATNVFVVDLEQGTVQRATVGSDGTDYAGVSLDPTNKVPQPPLVSGLALDDDAGAVAFDASDGNLFIGDANGATDVQVVRGAPGLTIAPSVFAAPPLLPVTVGPEAQAVTPIRAPEPIFPVIGYLTVDARGVARLTVRAPAAGRVVATASAPVRGRRLRVATTSRTFKAAATVSLRLTPAAAARRAARRRSIAVRIDVRYTPRRGRATTAVRSYVLKAGAAR